MPDRIREAERLLVERFGHDTFREGQGEAIAACLAGGDGLANARAFELFLHDPLAFFCAESHATLPVLNPTAPGPPRSDRPTGTRFEEGSRSTERRR